MRTKTRRKARTIEGVIEPIVNHQGMADPSASIGLSDYRFLTAGDEFNVFQVYNAMEGGAPLEEYDFSSFVNTKRPDKEADIEACAVRDNLVYWIGSHGRNGSGGLKWRRHQFFATQIKDHGDAVTIKQVGISYTGLITDLLQHKWFRDETDERLDPEDIPLLAAKERGSVNIEGLTSSANGILIGFRNPVPERGALLVELLNPEDVVLAGAHAEFGEPRYLDLGGRGIRSIDYWKERNIYIVSAGRYDSVRDFEFFTWGGKGTDLQPIDASILDGLNPESVVTFEGDTEKFLVVSDDGAETEPGENSPNKDRDQESQTFRTCWVSA